VAIASHISRQDGAKPSHNPLRWHAHIPYRHSSEWNRHEE